MPGTVLVGDDEYVMESALGAGTWRARTPADRAVVVELLSGDLDLGAVVDRMECCSHPNVPAFYEAFRTGDSFAIVHEYVDGAALAELQDRRLSEREMVTWLVQSLEVLAFCHLQGLVHGRVAPQRVVLREDRETFLVGFAAQPAGTAADDLADLADTYRALVAAATDPRVDAVVDALRARPLTAAEALERLGPLRAAR